MKKLTLGEKVQETLLVCLIIVAVVAVCVLFV